MKPKPLTSRLTNSFALCLGLLALLLVSPSAQAATVYWDDNGATPGAGVTATGTWIASGGTVQWSTDSTGSIATTDYATANGGSPEAADVIFSAGTDSTSAAVTISGAVAAQSITVEEIMTFTSATNTPSLALGSGGLTINSTATGAMTWVSSLPTVLAATQSWANNSSFLLTLNGGGTGGVAGSATASNTHTLDITSSGPAGITIGQNLSDGANGGALAVNINTTGTGVTTVAGASSLMTGGITLTQGIMRASSGGSTTNVLNVANIGGLTLAGGELRLVRAANSNATTFTAANTTVTGDVQITSEVGNGTAGRVHTMGTLSVGAQTLTVTSGSMVDSGTAGVTFGATTISGASTFNVVNGATNTSRLNLGALTGSSAITKTGSGELNLSAATAAFSGGLNIENGTAILSSGTSLGTDGVATINLGKNGAAESATLNLTAAAAYSANPITVQSGNGTRAILVSGSTSGNTNLNYQGAVTLANNLAITNSFTDSGNSGVEFSGGFSGTGNITLNNTPASGGTVLYLGLEDSASGNEVNNNGNITNLSTGADAVLIKAPLGSAVDTVIQDSSTSNMVLAAANTNFAGNVEVRQGTLRIGDNSALSAANTVAVGTSGIFDLKQLNTTTYNQTIAGLNDISGAGGIVTNSGGTARTISLDGAGNYGFSGEIAATTPANMAITKSGSGTQTLSGANTYTGTTAISAGTMLIEGSLASATISVTGGTLGGSGTIAGIVTIDNTATLSPGSSPGTLTINSDLNLLNGSTYLFEAGDLTNVIGQLDLDSTWTLSLAANANWQLGGTTVLFDYGTVAASPWLTPIIVDNTSLGGSGLTLSDDGSKIYLNGYSVVPEPSTWALLAFSLTAVLVLLRRRIS